MNIITNVSNVTDYSGEPPVVVNSNPVTTVIRQPAPQPRITRIFYNLNCGCCANNCNCNCNMCNCNSCARCDCCNCMNGCQNGCCGDFFI